MKRQPVLLFFTAIDIQLNVKCKRVSRYIGIEASKSDDDLKITRHVK